MDVEGAGDLGEGTLVEIIGGEQEAIFGALVGEGLLDGGGEEGQFFGVRRFRRRGCGRVAGGGFGGGIGELLFAPGLAVVVDVALGDGGAQPAEQRSAALVGGERGAAMAVAQVEAVELGVEAVGEFAALGFIAGDGDGGAGEGLLVECEEALPGARLALGAGVGERQVGEAQAAEIGGLNLGGGRDSGGVAVVLFASAGDQDRGEFAAVEVAGVGIGLLPKVFEKRFWKARGRGGQFAGRGNRDGLGWCDSHASRYRTGGY